MDSLSLAFLPWNKRIPVVQQWEVLKIAYDSLVLSLSVCTNFPHGSVHSSVSTANNRVSNHQHTKIGKDMHTLIILIWQFRGITSLLYMKVCRFC